MTIEEIYNYMDFGEKLSSSGMPTAEQMESVAKAGVQVVINLAPHDAQNALPNEAELVTSLGMQYINIPVNWLTPTRDGFHKFMDEMEAYKDKKIHVHCQANFRASAFISLYQILKLNLKKDDALAVMHTIWDEEEFPVWKMFIEDTLRRSPEGS
jgi:protein tyrosine phosphatase (PTP) superfamily phosphohydrolase (DUF442 family)